MSLKQTFGWAIVTQRGRLMLFSQQCPIYFRRNRAQAACDRQNRAVRAVGGDWTFHVEKVTILAVYR